MATPVGSILRAATHEPGERLHILTFPTHERYSQGLSRCNAFWYLYQGQGIKTWNPIYAPLPANHVLYDGSKGESQIPLRQDFDLVLSQNKFAHWQTATKLAAKYHLPLVSLEHCLPPPNMTPAALMQMKQMKAHVNVFISEFSRGAWGWDETEAEVIHHGVDTETFSPPKDGVVFTKLRHILSVVNDWINRDWCCGFKLWQKVTDGLSVRPVGDTPGLSKPAGSVAELANEYRYAQVFLNTSLISPVPTSLLEAMACGCAVVTTATAMIPEVIQHGVNGFMSNDPAQLREFCQLLLRDESLAKKLGDAARRTILERFSIGKFVSRWDEVFAKAANMVFRG